LGKSGTGKSTHSRLWLDYVEGSELLNDDNPVVRIIDGNPLFMVHHGVVRLPVTAMKGFTERDCKVGTGTTESN
jgi:hypothetical protein